MKPAGVFVLTLTAVFMTAGVSVSSTEAPARSGVPTAGLPAKTAELSVGYEFSEMFWAMQGISSADLADRVSESVAKLRMGIDWGTTAAIEAPYLINKSTNSYYPSIREEYGLRAPTVSLDKTFGDPANGTAISAGVGYQGYDRDMMSRLNDAVIANIAASTTAGPSIRVYGQYRAAVKTANANSRHILEMGLSDRNATGSHGEVSIFAESVPSTTITYSPSSSTTTPVTYQAGVIVGGGVTSQILLREGLFLEPHGKVYFATDRTIRVNGASVGATGFSGFNVGLSVTYSFNY